MEPNKRLALKYCLLLLFSILCGVFQITNTAFKFWNQKPTLEHYIEEHETLMPPSITVCGSQNFNNSDSGYFQSFDKEDQEFEHWPDADVSDHWKGKSLGTPHPNQAVGSLN